MLPESDKREIEMVNSPKFRGDIRVGGERTRGSPDWREQFDFGVGREPARHCPHNGDWIGA